MKSPLARRQFLMAGAAALCRAAFPQENEQVIPFLDTKPPNPDRPMLPWDQTTSWMTPMEHFFSVAHYGMPEVDMASWRLDIRGLVDQPRSFTLESLKARPKREHTITLECSGNSAAGGLIGNARWAGTPMAPLLQECGLKPEGIEVVFFGVDRGSEK